jgi:anti-sigma B factor antagonist
MTSGLTMDVVDSDGHAIVAVNGEIDFSTAREVRERLITLISNGARHVVVDLGGTAYMDATGVDMLVHTFKLLSALGGTLSIVCPQEHLAKLFRISSLSDALRVYSTREEASLQSGSQL